MEAPEFYHHHHQQSAAAGFCSPQFINEKLGRHHLQHHNSLESKPSGGDHFVVEDLLDFSNEEDAVIADANIGTSCGAANDVAFDTVVKGHSNDSSSVTVVDSCNSSSFSGCEPSFNGDVGHFCNDLSVPYDDMAELEWLSNFVEESFSSEDLQKLQLISGMKAHGAGPDESSETRNFQPGRCNGSNNADNAAIIHATGANSDDNNNINNPIFHPDMSVPAKARSKRSRTAPCNWASRLLLLSSPTASSTTEPEIAAAGPAPQHPISWKKTVKSAAPRKRDGGGGSSDGGNGNGEGRKCLHCATDKTPQWRTGPMGPKTLCNACGVRYKSGRLVPEYRPAASPTFVLTKHSNSHRKVLELRRQKELMRAQQQQQQQFLGHHHHHHHHHHQNMVFDVSSNGDDYLIHQHVGPDFRQLI